VLSKPEYCNIKITDLRAIFCVWNACRLMLREEDTASALKHATEENILYEGRKGSERK
jgi:hypothetical protein